jgi:hypothetical protein
LRTIDDIFTDLKRPPHNPYKYLFNTKMVLPYILCRVYFLFIHILCWIVLLHMFLYPLFLLSATLNLIYQALVAGELFDAAYFFRTTLIYGVVIGISGYCFLWLFEYVDRQLTITQKCCDHFDLRPPKIFFLP